MKYKNPFSRPLNNTWCHSPIEGWASQQTNVNRTKKEKNPRKLGTVCSSRSQLKVFVPNAGVRWGCEIHVTELKRTSEQKYAALQIWETVAWGWKAQEALTDQLKCALTGEGRTPSMGPYVLIMVWLSYLKMVSNVHPYGVHPGWQNRSQSFSKKHLAERLSQPELHIDSGEKFPLGKLETRERCSGWGERQNVP